MISPASSAQTTSQSQSAGTTQPSALTSDFETFLLMLTAQAQNQDPLEPLDSSEYASQLAQFSMVEQQVQTNDLLTSLAVSLSSVNLDELASWVGMDVRSASTFDFDGAPVTLFVDPVQAADNAILVVRDKDGTVIDRSPMPEPMSEFEWAGTDSSGNPLPPGSYSATLESYKDDELLSEQMAETYHRVIEAQVGENSVHLTLEDGQVVSAGLVTAIRTGA